MNLNVNFGKKDVNPNYVNDIGGESCKFQFYLNYHMINNIG